MPHQLGPNGDVKLVRSGPSKLTIEGNLGVSGSLSLKELKIGGMDLTQYIMKIVEDVVKKSQKKD